MFKEIVKKDIERLRVRSVLIGSEPCDQEDCMLVNVETIKGELTLLKTLILVSKCIDEWDSSDNVNSFTLFGKKLWLDKATRVGLVNAVQSAITLEQEEITLGLGDESYTLPCQQALIMLAKLEQYALACYNTTLRHKNKIKEFTNVYDLLKYNYCEGYPEKLEF